MFGDLHVDVEVAGEAIDEADLAYLEASVGRSAVYNLLTLAHRCEPWISLRDGSRTAD